jgi:alpha-D-xyloside xylohydrolase
VSSSATTSGEALGHNPMMQLGGLLGAWPEHPERQFVDQVTDVAVDGRRVRFTCRTNRGETCTVVLTACSSGVLQLTLIAGDESPPAPLPVPILALEQLDPVSVDVQEDPERITVSFGALTAVVSRQPWELRLLDARGRLLVGEHRADTNLRGWPRTRWLGYARDAMGRVGRCYEAFALRPQERIFGLGEKFMPLDKRGRVIESWNWNTWGASDERAYKNVPLYLSTAGYGCFVHTTRRVAWDFGSGQESSISLSFEAEGSRLDVFLIHGPAFPAILERYTALTGRAPVPPCWSFGFWMSYVRYRSWDEVDQVARELRARHIPADVIHLDPGWLRPGMFADLVWDESRFPEPARHLASLREQGFRICLWVQPWIPLDSEVFSAGAASGYFARTASGEVYRYVPTVPGDPPRPAAIVDFTNPGTQRWYKERLKALIRQGVAAFKTDFGEAIAEDAVFANGMTGRELHNAYPLLYNACFYEAFAEAGVEPLVWGRSGWAGIQRFPVSWSGDQLCNYPSMVCTLWSGLSFGLSGAAFWSHDIGGFEGRPDPELYVRWAQWGLLSSHSRAHGTTRREPWTFGEQAARIFARFARLRYRLIPYLYSCAHEASMTGMPVMRALVLLDHADPNAWAADTQYLLGPDLLVCPVTAPGVDVLRVYLPPGRWYDFWSGEPRSGGLWQELPVTLERIPLFVRGGAVLPVGPEEEWVGQRDGERLTLLVYPDEAGRAVSRFRHDRGEATFTYHDGTLSSRGVAPDRPLVAQLAPGGGRIQVT